VQLFFILFSESCKADKARTRKEQGSRFRHRCYRCKVVQPVTISLMIIRIKNYRFKLFIVVPLDSNKIASFVGLLLKIDPQANCLCDTIYRCCCTAVGRILYVEIEVVV
jgi:hypothetical protein